MWSKSGGGLAIKFDQINKEKVANVMLKDLRNVSYNSLYQDGNNTNKGLRNYLCAVPNTQV